MTAFLVATGLIFLTAAASGSVAVRIGLPRVVGEMSAGLILGQSLLGHAWPRAENYLFGQTTLDALQPLGLLIVLLYVALVGAELDRRVLRGRIRSFGLATVAGLGAALGGAAVFVFALSDLEPSGIARWTFFLFLTGALLVTAVPVLARILDETGLIQTRVGTTTLTLSIADDFVAFSMIAVAIAVATDGSLGLALVGTGCIAVLVVFRKHAARLCRRLPEARAVSALGIGLLALLAGAVGSLGASTLVMAFMVGVLLWRPASPVGRVRGGELVRALVPLYIVFAALSVDVRQLANTRLAFGIFLVTVLAIGTKVVACLIAGRLLALSRSETLSLVVLRNTRGLTELVALNLGYQAGLLSHDLYAVFFSMALLTTATSGVIALRVLRPLETVSRGSAVGGEAESGVRANPSDWVVTESSPAR
jgi:K+:H+ antiporter